MKRTMLVLVASLMIVGLCIGCGEGEKPKPTAGKPAKEGEANWEPERVEPEGSKPSGEGHDHNGCGHKH